MTYRNIYSILVVCLAIWLKKCESFSLHQHSIVKGIIPLDFREYDKSHTIPYLKSSKSTHLYFDASSYDIIENSKSFLLNLPGFPDFEIFKQYFSSTQSIESSVEPINVGGLNPLGNDLLIFLCATIGIVPLFKWLKASSVIGFLTAGLLMGPNGLKLFTDLNDMESLADFGITFLLFEQGLELTVDRLQKLSKYAFGMGTLQILLSTIAFFVFPFLGGVQFLEYVIQSNPEVVDITRIDEAVVIGAALSLSSSAFVLKILQEKQQLSTQFGAACLGVLLMQDIAVVPLLVLLPIIESSSGQLTIGTQLIILGTTFFKALFGLGGILVVGGSIVRYLFSLVAQSKSSETFVALCLLVALGTGALTESFGLSSTLGSFTAGTLLASSNYRTQIESDIKPFRGLLLGLFFITTGATVDLNVILDQFPTVIALLVGLIVFKAIITSILGKIFGLSNADSIKTGLILSGGGEFAFVVLNLADKLKILPDVLAKILVGVVVISMALTPYLSLLGDKLATLIDNYDKNISDIDLSNADNRYDGLDSSKVIVICGFNDVGATTMKIIKNAFNEELGNEFKCVAFDLDPNLVLQGYRNGVSIFYGDGTSREVLEIAGIDPLNLKAFIITYDDSEECLKAVEKLRFSFPLTPIIVRSSELHNIPKLFSSGANEVISDEVEASIQLSKSTFRLLELSDNFDAERIYYSEEIDKSSIEARVLAFNDENVDKNYSKYLTSATYSQVADKSDYENNDIDSSGDDGSVICALPNSKIVIDDSKKFN